MIHAVNPNQTVTLKTPDGMVIKQAARGASLKPYKTFDSDGPKISSSIGASVHQSSPSNGANIPERSSSTGASVDQSSSSTGASVDQSSPSDGANITESSSSAGASVTQESIECRYRHLSGVDARR